MRDFFLWGLAAVLLLAALVTVRLRLEVNGVGRAIGRIAEEIQEERRRNDNRAIDWERACSPERLAERAQAMGLLPGDGR